MKVFLRFIQHTRKERDFSFPVEERRIDPEAISFSSHTTEHFPTLSSAKAFFAERMRDDPDIAISSMSNFHHPGGLIRGLRSLLFPEGAHLPPKVLIILG